MPLPCSGTLNVLDLHHVPCLVLQLLLFNGSSAWNIVNILLIPYEFWGCWIQVSYALEVVPRIEWILGDAISGEFDALRPSSLDVIYPQGVLYLVEANVQIAGH